MAFSFLSRGHETQVDGSFFLTFMIKKHMTRLIQLEAGKYSLEDFNSRIKRALDEIDRETHRMSPQTLRALLITPKAGFIRAAHKTSHEKP